MKRVKLLLLVALALIARTSGLDDRTGKSGTVNGKPATSATDRVACRAHDGHPVDWFVIYKLPAHTERTPPGPSTPGLAYLYLDSGMMADSWGGGTSWMASPVVIDSQDSMPGLTLRPVYSASEDSDLLVLMYNDEMPNGTSSESAAHAKGVIAFDGQSGFWMTHSVPRYPPAPDSAYSYPPTGERYGQTLFCVSLGFDQADLIGQQLLFYRPFVYYWRSAGDAFAHAIPNLYAAARGEHVGHAPWFRRVQLTSRRQTLDLTSFAKSRPFGRDLYSEWMSDELQSPLFVETWTNGQGHPMPTDCSNRSYAVLNVKQVRLESVDYGNPTAFRTETFSSHDDHSKWAVSGIEEHPWVCIADINRMESQRHRGGGSLCFHHERLWRHFLRAADRLEACPLSASPVSLGYPAGKKNPLRLAKKKKKMTMLGTMNKMKMNH